MFRNLITLNIVLMMLVAVMPVTAQEDDTVTITVTEFEINDRLAECEGDTNVSVFFHEDQIEIRGLSNHEDQIEIRGLVNNATRHLIVVPTVVDNRLDLLLVDAYLEDSDGSTVSLFDDEGNVTPLEYMTPCKASPKIALEVLVRDKLDVPRALESVTVTEDAFITIWSYPVDSPRDIASGRATGKRSITEDQFNSALAVIASRRENIEALRADIQDGKISLTGKFNLPNSGNSAEWSLVLMPDPAFQMPETANCYMKIPDIAGEFTSGASTEGEIPTDSFSFRITKMLKRFLQLQRLEDRDEPFTLIIAEDEIIIAVGCDEQD